MVLPRWTKGTAASALPASLALLAGATPATAQTAAPGPQLRILTPRANDALGSAKFDMDVSFDSRSGTPVTAAEVWVDGVRWLRRDLERVQKRGVLTFEVDGSTLSEGTHALVVTLFDATGASSSATINIVAGNNTGISSGALGGPEMSFVAPGNGKRVSGTLDLNVDVQNKGGANAYVTFFIDNEFKTLKNYPPYSYTWDTTRATNGWHTVEALGYVEGSKTATTRRLRVYVDNPGGNTARMEEIPDLAAAAAAPKSAASAAKPLHIPLPKALTSAPAARPAPVRVARAEFPRPVLLPPAAVAATPDERAARPRIGARTAAPVAPAAPAALAAPAAITRGAPRPAPLRAGNKLGVSLAAPVMAIPSAARRPSQAQPARPEPVLSAKPAASRVVAKAGPEFRVVPAGVAAPPSLATPRATVRHSAAAAAPALAAAPASDSRPNGPLQVAFDGERIAFDVPPRVEAGLPLTPFRQIFEHTGGVVTWVPSTRVVRAVNAEREIVLTVGDSTARVNDQAVSLEKPVFLLQGRALVPLSFVGKALNVDIQYDPATGRLQITSK